MPEFTYTDLLPLENLSAVDGVAHDAMAAWSGEEEARLSFVGATRTLVDAPAGTVAVIDVGGGSSEIAIGEANDVRLVED